MSCCHAAGVVEAPAASALSAAVRGLLRAMIMENETVTEWDEPPGVCLCGPAGLAPA